MPLRLLRGRVLAGHEEEFDARLRDGVESIAPAAGLQSFMAGYRRLEGQEKFVLASAWDSDEHLVRALGDDPLRNPRLFASIGGAAELENVEHYQLIRPLPAGLLDAPGAVLRVARAVLRPGRFEALLDWLERKEREINAAQLLLGWMVGWREREGRTEFAGVSAWASPLQYEAIADAGLGGAMLFADLAGFVTDFEVELYQAIELRLSARLQSLGGRRLIVARFDSPHSAAQARAGLIRAFVTADDDVSVARMAGGASDRQVFVARVQLADHARAQRLIADHGGQIVYEADEGRAAGGIARPF